ncbi:short-chain dehydrogenase [Zhengella mangrovi]|uniref:Short-chain dehydrogenase n=1 Tax=Zhengella mangrovi TaxID=1982044 RepID=A0A2G1QML9_9HYPH|nr:SDR family NAD(P)-dependent oxidoreductase [Zhengella mangrovi]PHP66775.1 short-chain dehydrogenase [Zhengella mangrovi]
MNGQEFFGKAAFLTGAGSGIGARIALLLAQRGASVAVTDVNEDAARAVAQTIQADGGKAIALALDVTSTVAASEAVAATIEAFGGLDFAVNNAGVTTPRIATADIPDDEWQRQVSINLTGVFNCMKAEIPAMLARGGGSIVNTSSILGVLAVEHRAGYAAAKHGVIGLTKTAALDYAEQNIRVNAIAPGYVDTPILADRNPEQRAEIASRHPLNRMARPSEIAESAIFLLSDKASFITGTVLGVDGGYTAR